MTPKKKKPSAPMAKAHREKDERQEARLVPPGTQAQAAQLQQLSFPFSSKLTSPSFGQSLLTWVRSDAFPIEGESASAIARQVKLIRESLDLMEARWRDSLSTDPDAIPGWGLSPGAMVRETFRVTAFKIWQQLQKVPGNELELRDVLSCSRVNMAELAERVALGSGIEPKVAQDWLWSALEGLFPVRQNRPSLRRLGAEEAYAQRERLEEGGKADT